MEKIKTSHFKILSWNNEKLTCERGTLRIYGNRHRKRALELLWQVMGNQKNFKVAIYFVRNLFYHTCLFLNNCFLFWDRIYIFLFKYSFYETFSALFWGMGVKHADVNILECIYITTKTKAFLYHWNVRYIFGLFYWQIVAIKMVKNTNKFFVLQKSVYVCSYSLNLRGDLSRFLDKIFHLNQVQKNTSR